MTNIRDAAQRILDDAYDDDAGLLIDSEECAVAVLSAPRWHKRPTGPGMWAYMRSENETFPFAAQEFDMDDIARGAPFHVVAVYGPIPQCDIEETR